MSFASAPVRGPRREINKQAAILLKELGLVRRAATSVCGIRMAIEEMTGRDIDVNWRRFFGARYKSAEARIVMSKGYFKTDPQRVGERGRHLRRLDARIALQKGHFARGLHAGQDWQRA